MPYTIPEYIEIKATDGSTVAFLSPKSDNLKDCWIDDDQNGSCTLEFELPLNSPKWQYLTDQYRIHAGGKEFVILNPDAVDKQRDGQKLKGKVKAHESWVLLGKKYQTISNDPLIGTPPWGAVIIVSGGTAHGGFDAGSAGSALSYLLQGTGWTVGTVDVTGIYDLETEKESVLYNINQVQEKWGGILIWDSVNKTVSLRDEESWQNYTGYQIRYAKNLKDITRSDDYDIVTRLYVFGENDLNMANVNSGLLYLDNHSYSDDILEGVWYNQDLADQAQLKVQGEKQLAVMCRPRHNYKTEVLDLRSLPGYGHETFKRSDMVDLFDEDFGANARVRIIRYRHNVFQPWLCDMELGDPLEKIAASVAQTVLMAKFYKNVVAPNTSFQNLLKAIINTEATEINGASGDYTLVDGVSTWFDRDDVTGELTGKLLRITPQGLIISYDGGQTWKLAISGEGIHADAGWVGKLNAGLITVGPETTFAPGYDPTLIDPSASATMGVDSDCLGLWHFDGSLNSHKGVTAIGDENFDAGCFGQAVKVEEGTTNLVANGDFEVDTAGWGTWQASIERVTAEKWAGNASMKVILTETNGAASTNVALSSPVVGTTYTGSFYVKGAPGKIARMLLRLSGGANATSDLYSPEITCDGTWQRIIFSRAIDYSDRTTISPHFYSSANTVGDTYYVDGAQLEQKPYATSFANGTRLGSLKAPASGLAPSQGTISLRAKNLSASVNGSVLIDLPKSDNAQGIQAGISSDTGHEGEVYIAEATPTFSYLETTQADFNTGTLVDVVATSAGDLQLASGKTIGTREKVVDISEVGETNVGSSLSFSKTDAVVTDATFTRNSEAYMEDGTKVTANTPRFESGGVLIEEGTTNLVANGDFENDMTGWALSAQTARSTTKAKFGSYSLAVTNPPGAQNSAWSPEIALSPNTTYTFSLWLATTMSGSRVNIVEYDSSDNALTFDAPASDLRFVVANGGVWERKTLTITTQATCVKAKIRLVSPAGTGVNYYDGFQLEQKPYPTSFANGTRANEVLKLPANLLNKGNWTVSLKYKTEQQENPVFYHVLWDCCLGAGDWYQISFENGTRELLLRVVSDAAFYVLRSGIILSAGTSYDIVATGDGSNLSLYVDGVKVGTTPYVEPIGALSEYMYIGSTFHPAHYANGIIDELAIFDYAATDTEVSNWHSSGISFQQGCVYKMDFTNNLQATVGSVKVETALSTDGGATYGALQEAVSGQAIPGITNSTDLSEAKLKIKETLYTSSVTPKLHDLSLGIIKRLPTTVYGPNKSTLTGWDSIALAWKSDRLSLVVNDTEACYIENPGLPTAFGSYLFIGSDRNGANSINTLVDELRIDKVYREVNIRTGWHKTGVPFYTSEDMKQWPGYLKAETDGLKVYDSSNALRVLVGSWLKGLIRKYGIKIIDGEIYSSIIRSGAEDADTYIQFKPPNSLEVYYGGYLQMLIEAVSGGRITFYNNGTMIGRLSGAYSGADLGIIGIGTGKVTIADNLYVTGTISAGGSKPAQQVTENYGLRYLYATEAPEIIYYDRGVINLTDGEATVYLDPIYLECIEPHTELTPWQIWVQCYGENDVYVSEIGVDYFVVKERNGGTSNNRVVWKHEAIRNGYAGIRLMEVTN